MNATSATIREPGAIRRVGAFAAQYLVTMRPYLLFVSGIAGVAGMASAPGLDPVGAWLIFVGAFLSYGFGQALTDCFQMDTDALYSPYRPLIRGIISRNQVLLVSFVGLAAGVLILSYLNPALLARTVLTIAHRLATVRHADRIVVLEDTNHDARADKRVCSGMTCSG